MAVILEEFKFLVHDLASEADDPVFEIHLQTFICEGRSCETTCTACVVM